LSRGLGDVYKRQV